MRKSAVCYVADENFLFAAIASALSLRSHEGSSRCDVIIFYAGSRGIAHSELVVLLRSSNITLQFLEESLLEYMNYPEWIGGHVSRAALGRLLIADYMAERYDRMIYVDGDTLFTADPRALLEFDPGEGKLAAAEDIRSFARHDVGRFGDETRAYFAAIGIGETDGYFNSGVFVVRTRSWVPMASAALAFFTANFNICKLVDQSAMNATLKDQRVKLSLRWNFQTPFKNLLLQRAISPQINHFTGASKPWVGPIIPWTTSFPWYSEVERQVAPLLQRPVWSSTRIYNQNRETKFFFYKMHMLFGPRVFIKRRKILRNEENSLTLY